MRGYTVPHLTHLLSFDPVGGTHKLGLPTSENLLLQLPELDPELTHISLLLESGVRVSARARQFRTDDKYILM